MCSKSSQFSWKGLPNRASSTLQRGDDEGPDSVFMATSMLSSLGVFQEFTPGKRFLRGLLEDGALLGVLCKDSLLLCRQPHIRVVLALSS